MSDVVSAPHSTAAQRLITSLTRGPKRALTALRVRAELDSMDDRTLADMGARRGDIPSIARRHAEAG